VDPAVIVRAAGYMDLPVTSHEYHHRCPAIYPSVSLRDTDGTLP
jgi:hypothetical protein